MAGSLHFTQAPISSVMYVIRRRFSRNLAGSSGLETAIKRRGFRVGGANWRVRKGKRERKTNGRMKGGTVVN